MMKSVIRQLVINFIVIEALYVQRNIVTQCDLLNDEISRMENSKVNFRAKITIFFKYKKKI